MLRLDRLTLAQGNFTLNATMELVPGRRYAVIGPSGAGKSTLLAALCGFLTPVMGRIFWHGTDITEQHPGARPMTMLFQDNNLFPHLSVLQNVGLGLRPDLRLSPVEREQVGSALARVGLQDHSDKRPAALSGGQQSRAALARVLVQARPWVLLDEPFAALGPALRQDMLALVDDLVGKTGAGLIMVTHAPEDATGIAEDVIFVSDSVAHPPRPVGPFFDNPPADVRAYLGDRANVRGA